MTEPGLRRGVAVVLSHRTPALGAAGSPAAGSPPRNRVDDLLLLLAAGLIGSGAIHAAVLPEHLSEWAAAAMFFMALTAAELAVAVLLLARLRAPVLLAATAVSLGPLVLWLYSRTVGMPFGPGAGAPERVGLADVASCVLEVGTLLLAVVLLRATERLKRRPPASANGRSLAALAVIAITAIGLAGSGLSWFDIGSSGGQPVMGSSQ